MAEKTSTSLQPRWRFDAIAVTLLAAGTLLAAAVGSSRAISGGPNVFGAWGDRAAALVLEPFGWAALALLAGWFTLTGLLVVNRTPGRLLLRAAGWCVLTVVAAVGVDWFGAGLPSPSLAGRGGSVGAYLRFALEDATQPEVAYALFALSAFIGLLLAMSRFVVGFSRVAGRVLSELWKCGVWLNDPSRT
jgi:S-DNA-T family DNA segregation ATPase FtsK/SpoIIIE